MYHLQNNPQDWPRAVAQLPPGSWVKFVDGIQRAREAKQANSGVKTVIRHWYDDRQQPGATLEDNIANARAFFSSFVDGSFVQEAPFIDAVEGWNEYFANGQDAATKARFISWSQAVNIVWTTEYKTRPEFRHIRLVCANTAVGNDIPLETARAVYDYGNILGYHPYVPVNRNLYADHPHFILPHEWQYYSGRWTAMDDLYRANGIRVQWLFTEWGAVGDYGGNRLGPNDGWRRDWIYNGNINEYLGMMQYWFDRFTAWNAAHNDRALWPLIFTSAPPGGENGPWWSFDLQQPNMDIVAQFIRDYVPGSPTDPPTNPPPQPPPSGGNPGMVNGDFEGGWYHPNGVPELQIPESWTFTHVTDQPNPYDSNPWSVYVRPEVRVLPENQLPAHERPLFIRDGRQTVKIFKGSGAWWGSLLQAVNLEAGVYRLHLPVFADLVKEYNQYGKVWADDPEQRDGQYRIHGGAWLPLIPGQWNEITHEFTHSGGTIDVGIEIRVNFALINAGVFMDGWSLTAVENPTPPPNPPPAQYRRVVNLLPQDATIEEKIAVVTNRHTSKETYCQSADDAGELVRGGRSDSFVRCYGSDRWPGDIVAYLRDNYGVTAVTEAWPTMPSGGGAVENPFLAWPTQYRHVTQRFGNNPAYYAKFGLPGHEGIDIRAPHGSNVYAVWPGEVYEAIAEDDGHNYGFRVRIRTGPYRVIYAHLAGTAVQVGDTVRAGQIIGWADNTGNSFGDHLHLTVKHDEAGHGGPMYQGYPYEIIDPTPYLPGTYTG